MNGTPDFTEGASRAINNFNNELWEKFQVSERFKVDGPKGETPTSRKQDTIEWLETLMDEVAHYYYRAGAWQGRREFLKMQKKAGVKNRKKNISRDDWKLVVIRRFGKAKKKYNDQDPPWPP